jgi:hypothetical protein
VVDGVGLRVMEPRVGGDMEILMPMVGMEVMVTPMEDMVGMEEVGGQDMGMELVGR